VDLIQPSIHPALAALAATLNVYRAVSAKRQKGPLKVRFAFSGHSAPRRIIPRFSAHTAEQRRRLLAAVIIDATPAATCTVYGILCKQMRNTTNPAMGYGQIQVLCFALALFAEPQEALCPAARLGLSATLPFLTQRLPWIY
jgi:hypothetical protein